MLFVFQRLLSFLPVLILLAVLVAAWHWASELLTELRTISKHLERIAGNLEAGT
jgi:hypothetical protein